MLWRNTDLSICPGIRDARHQSFSASTQQTQTRHARPKRTDKAYRCWDIHWRLATNIKIKIKKILWATHIHQSPMKSARSRHYYHTKSARSRQYYFASDRLITKVNVVYDVVLRRWSGKQLRPDIHPLWCSVWVVDGMLRAGSHYNLGTSRGPDKIGSPAGLGPLAVTCTWLR